MLKTVFLTAATLLMASLAPASTATTASDLTEYDRCTLDGYYGCFPGAETGNPYPPDLGNPDVAAAFEQCVAAAYARCAGLPGDPGA